MSTQSLQQCVGVEFLRECFDADIDAGTLTWLERPVRHFKAPRYAHSWNSVYAGRQVSPIQSKSGYAAVWVTCYGRRYGLLVHRVLWCMRTGSWPVETIDHADMNCRNNTRGNLRLASYGQQNANRGPIRNGLKGATFDKRTGLFLAQLMCVGKNHFLGRFDTEQEAHVAYMAAAHRHHGEFARGSA